jgi:hypothetical protein
MKEGETVRECGRRGWKYGNLTREFEGRSLFGRPRGRWDNNIKTDDKGIVSDKWRAVVKTVKNFQIT